MCDFSRFVMTHGSVGLRWAALRVRVSLPSCSCGRNQMGSPLGLECSRCLSSCRLPSTWPLVTAQSSQSFFTSRQLASTGKHSKRERSVPSTCQPLFTSGLSAPLAKKVTWSGPVSAWEETTQGLLWPPVFQTAPGPWETDDNVAKCPPQCLEDLNSHAQQAEDGPP